MEGSLIGFRVPPDGAGRWGLQDIEEPPEGDGPRGLSEESGAKVDEFFVRFDLGADLREAEVLAEGVEGDVEVRGEGGEGEIGLEHVEHEVVRPALRVCGCVAGVLVGDVVLCCDHAEKI